MSRAAAKLWARDADLEEAVSLADALMAAEDSAPGAEGLRLALDEAERAFEDRDPDHVQHLPMIFITHHGKGSSLPISGLANYRTRISEGWGPRLPGHAIASIAAEHDNAPLCDFPIRLGGDR